jgi:hypothetical protein
MSRLIDAALDHYVHLITQGTAPATAMAHAVQRFGVTAGDITAADQARHEFDLAVGPEPDEIMADYVALAVAERWIR